MESVGRQEKENRNEDRRTELGLGDGIKSTPPPQLQAWTLKGTRVALEVDLSIYSLEAIFRAAYKFTDRCYVFLSRDPAQPGTIAAVLAAKNQAADLGAIVGDFANELLDQRLRESLETQFGQVRTLIVAQAFSEGNLLDPIQDDGDYRSDPHGIGGRR
jgi:His-Xaa-Ser system protein HxsD